MLAGFDFYSSLISDSCAAVQDEPTSAEVSLTSSTSAKFGIFGGSTALAFLAAQLVLIPLIATETEAEFRDDERVRCLIRRRYCDPLRLLGETRNISRASVKLIKLDYSGSTVVCFDDSQ